MMGLGHVLLHPGVNLIMNYLDLISLAEAKFYSNRNWAHYLIYTYKASEILILLLYSYVINVIVGPTFIEVKFD